MPSPSPAACRTATSPQLSAPPARSASTTSSLGEGLGLGEVDEDDLYTALDWLLERQPAIEGALAKRHLSSGTLVLYDVSSSYLEGHCCPLAQRGYSRDGKRGTLQIVYGLLCAPDGCPIAIEVFDGKTADPMTLTAQIGKLRRRPRSNTSCCGQSGRHQTGCEGRSSPPPRPPSGGLTAPRARQSIPGQTTQTGTRPEG
jgi:hypothetical protein